MFQGVEERPVNTANDIFTILEGTNKQRRTAETLCNKQSSRCADQVQSIFILLTSFLRAGVIQSSH